MIYFIQAGQGGPVKIGFTKDEMTLNGRIESLQTGNHQKLRLLWLAEGDERLERFVHRRLKAFRLNGEWFQWTPEIEEFYVVARTLNLTVAMDRTADAPWAPRYQR